MYISAVGNAQLPHRYTWFSTAFVGLGILEQVLSYGCDGFESALTGGASAASSGRRRSSTRRAPTLAMATQPGGDRRQRRARQLPTAAEGIFNNSARRLSDVAAHAHHVQVRLAAFTEEYCRQFNIPSSLGAVEGRDITDWVRSMNNFDWLRLLISVYYLLIMWCYVMILFDHYDVMLNESSNKIISAITKKSRRGKPSIWLANRCGRGAFTRCR